MGVLAGLVVGLLILAAGVGLWRWAPAVLAGERATTRPLTVRAARFDMWTCRVLGVVLMLAGLAIVVLAGASALSG